MLPTSGDQGGQGCWERGRAPSWEEGCWGDPTCHSLDGPLHPRGGPWAAGSQAADALGGRWAGTACEEETSKAPLIPGDIFRHRSLLFYAADQSPELYK